MNSGRDEMFHDDLIELQTESSTETSKVKHANQTSENRTYALRSLLMKAKLDNPCNIRQRYSSWFDHISSMNIFYLRFAVIPTLISLIYAIAILFPAEARAKRPLLLWTDGAFVKGENGDPPYFCPQESLCSVGMLQILLIGVSRLTAFASYIFMALTYLSKMSCTVHALSTSFVGTIIPLARLQSTVHKNVGKWYCGLAIAHSITHVVRWYIRDDMNWINTTVGLSGVIGVFSILMTIASMSSFGKLLSNKFKSVTYETRFNAHWVFFISLNFALCLHTPRCRIITIACFGLWFSDYMYGFIFKTYRLDLVEFTPLPGESGVQMLWRNPPGFNANSGEYVKVQLPWLTNGGTEWHPFSIYLDEETEEGLDEVLRKKYDVNKNRAHLGGCGKFVVPSKTAVLLIEYQNEFASEQGQLYHTVEKVMRSTNMLQNTVDLVEEARLEGAYIFHLPVLLDASGEDNPNKSLGILQTCYRSKFFVKGTWNAEIIDCLRPKIEDIIIQNKKGPDGFIGTDLQEQLEKRGIKTIILGGFLTNASVESTMRTGYEKGYNVITLEDATACNSHTELNASIMGSFRMFSTPMNCSEAVELLAGSLPNRLLDASMHAFAAVVEEDLESPGPVIASDLHSFIHICIRADQQGETDGANQQSLIKEEVREQIRSQYQTTQIFMVPSGDWTKQVYNEVTHDCQLRHCWVKGPYVSPYSVVSNFSHLVLVASGIGITPALGVIGQYKGHSRTKILVWITRCPRMLKFFVHLLKDATMAIIYYTGQEPLSEAELKGLTSGRNIFIQTSRPESLTDTVGTVIADVTSLTTAGSYRAHDTILENVKQIPQKVRKQWCILYCGGSTNIKDTLKDYSKEVELKFEYELFDW